MTPQQETPAEQVVNVLSVEIWELWYHAPYMSKTPSWGIRLREQLRATYREAVTMDNYYADILSYS